MSNPQGPGGVSANYSDSATIEEIIASARLPQSLEKTVRLVVRFARLRRGERRRIAARLCNRFNEGLAAGRSAEELSAELGKPRAAARRFRREAMRGRSLPDRIFRRVRQAITGVLVLLVAMYVICFIRFHGMKPNIAVDHVGEYNRRVTAGPADELAWPLYQQAILAWTPPPFDSLPDLLVSYPRLKPDSPGWLPAVGNLKDNAAALEIVRRAAKRPRLGLPLGLYPDPALVSKYGQERRDQVVAYTALAATQPAFFELDLSAISELRNICFMCRFDMHEAAIAGDAERVCADVDAMLGMARQLREIDLIIADLSSAGIVEATLLELNYLMSGNHGLFSDAQLQRLARIVAGPEDTDNPYRIRIDCLRLERDSLLQHMYSDNGSGDGSVIAGGLLLYLACRDNVYAPEPGPQPATMLTTLFGPLTQLCVASRREMRDASNLQLDEMDRISHLPLWELTDTPESWWEALSGLDRVRFRPMQKVFAVLPGRAFAAGELALQARDCTLVVIALERYRLHEGTYPSALHALVPALLTSVPPDRYSGRPLNYILRGGQPLLYSVGVDRIDNGGAPHAWGSLNEQAQPWISPQRVADRLEVLSRDPAAAPSSMDIRGDWILWPEQKAVPEEKK